MFPCFLSPVTVFLSLLPQAMFSLCMVESGADEVNLHGVTSLGLKQALEFAYTGQVWYQMSSERLDFTWPEEIILEE